MNKQDMYHLALPTIIENILQMSLSTADTWFVASLGALAISSVGLNTLISNIYLAFFIAMGTGISILTARSDGEKSPDKTRDYIRQGIILNLAINSMILFINLFFGRLFINFLAKDSNMINLAYTYFQVVILPIIGLSFMTIFSSILKSLNDTKTPMYTVLIINIINVLLDWILIGGYGDFKGLGILGAGIATTIARLIGMLILLVRLQAITGFANNFSLKFTSALHTMMGYALPVGMEKLSKNFGQLIYGSLILSIGIDHYAGHNIAGTIEAYSYLPAMGFGVAAFTMIGHAIGEKKYQNLRKIGLMSYKSASLMMVVIGMVFFVFSPQLTSLFTNDPNVAYLVVTVLKLIAIFQPMLACTQVLSSSLQAIGDVKYIFYLTTFGIWGIRILGTYILGIQLEMGLIGVWISYVIDISFRGILLIRRFYKKTASLDAMKEVFENHA